MEKEFFEKQQIGNWIYILLGVDFMVVSLFLFNEYKKGETNLNETLLNLGFVLILNLLIVFFIRNNAIYTKVSKEGVLYKFPPFCSKWKLIPFEKITDFQIQNYSSFNHGCAVGKWNLFSKEDTITTLGTDKVMRIMYDAKKPLLISTSKANEFYDTLKKFKSETYNPEFIEENYV
ncbi:hypothetical protein [Mangrovimonas sp. DI 80]|uniref:hypothetical protein n=1 Tax=Mangrovimonas sp. DI 80 TaxID=1779330 RepID=UPI0009763B5E|nr:hypothetical protein [Mangrovimonas sp. DI 80]OMP31081.1 hypothetical protein BKM32_08425 [Mangrovimonas sp. DI 80]